MSLPALLLVAALAPADGLRVAARAVDGETLVDASGTSVEPIALLRELVAASGLSLRGEELLAAAARLDVGLEARPLDEALDALSLATLTRIRVEGDVVTVAPVTAARAAEDLDLDAELAWLAIVRDYPDEEAARLARFQLGRIQELRGSEDAALVHYDAAADTTVASPAAERALEAASTVLLRRKDYAQAMQRLTRLAQVATDSDVQIDARLAIVRVLAEQGRGAEALALLDAIDLTWPPRDDDEVLYRRLYRSRAFLSCDKALEAVRQLDVRAATDPRLGASREDLELRARALEKLGAPLEAARAWLAHAAQSSGAEQQDAYVAAAQLALAGGDDMCVLFVERLAQDGARAAEVARLARAARERMGLAPDLAAEPVAALDARWAARASLHPAERAALAARLVPILDRARGVEAALALARTALAELDGADGAPIRAALAEAYERRGLWAEAARTWGGTLP